MRKRLFCMLLAVSMIGTSMTAYAAEIEQQQAVESPAAEEETGEEEQEELPDATPDVTPGEVPEAAPEEEPEATPEAQPTAAPEAVSDEEAEASPEESPVPEEIEDPDLVSEEEEDELLKATSTYAGEKEVIADRTLDKSWTIDGGLKIGKNGKLRIGNNKLVVNGDVECAGDIYMDIGSILEINGNLIHGSGTLTIGGGSVDITGNYRMQNRDGAGNYSVGSGMLGYGNPSNRLNIGGHFITESSKASTYRYCGTMTVKGDVIQMEAGGSDRFWGNNDFKLIMAGDGPQKISMANKNSNISHLQLDNKDITVDGYFNAILDSESNYIKPAGGTLKVTDLDLSNHKLEVAGSVECTGTLHLKGSNGNLVVEGDYIQPSGSLNMDGGSVDITGDCRMQNRDGAGNYSVGSGMLGYGNPSDRLNIGGHFITESSKASTYRYCGTMTVKGDVIQMEAGGSDRFWGNNDFKLIMAGDGPQKISMANKNSSISHLQLDNKDITVDGYFNAILDSESNYIKPAGGTLKVTGLKLNNHKLEVAGNIRASGDIDMGGTSGHLVVKGSHIQTAGCLAITGGRMDVSGDLRLQMQDESGNYGTGDGYLEMAGASGRLDIGGDFVMQSTKNTNLRKGTITLTGDMIQSSSNGAVGYVNGTSKEHKTILMKINSQKLLFDNNKSKVGTLQLSGNKSDYRFSFEPCWIQLITWPFADVTVAAGWRFDSIKYVYDNNIMNGISGTDRFDPDEPLTRAMFATVLYRMAGNPAVTFENHFSDVKSGIYYSNAVIWAWKEGIVNGYQDGRFGVNDNITREQIAKMLNKYAEVRKYDISERADINSFPDVSDVSGWAVGFIQWAVGSGMVTGKNVGGTYYLDPKGNATRVECAAMLTRFMKRYAS